MDVNEDEPNGSKEAPGAEAVYVAVVAAVEKTVDFGGDARSTNFTNARGVRSAAGVMGSIFV